MITAPPENAEHRAARSFQQICQEPFRIFFPAGVILGLAGVSLWVAFYLGAGTPYPNIAHARLMVEGFMASFIFGFLGTAGPRLTSAPAFSLPELGAVFTLDLVAAGLHMGEAHRAGDICFTACLLMFAWALARRFRQRKDSPPPNLVLVALGLISGIIGCALVAATEGALYSRTYQFASALLNQGFVLLPILGVGPFFLGRLLNLPGPELPESRAFPPGWMRQAAFAAFIGVTIIASFLVDAFDLPRLGGWIRVLALALYLGSRMPWGGQSFLANYLRAGVLFILGGFTLIAFFPNYRIGLLHVVFVTGFNLLIFTVATRVIFGHSGYLARLKLRLWFFIWASALLFVAMASRVTADLLPRSRVMHLVAAAVCWLAAALIWVGWVIPKVRLVEAETEDPRG